MIFSFLTDYRSLTVRQRIVVVPFAFFNLSCFVVDAGGQESVRFDLYLTDIRS
jgi:hypothetical protein